MKNILNDSDLIRKYSGPLRGVFRLSDLEMIFCDPHKSSVYRRIAYLEEKEVIRRFIKGFYVTPDFHLECLNQKIAPDSYISLGNILAQHLIIGVTPRYQIDAVKIGKTRVYQCGSYYIKQFGCSEAHFFGFENVQGILKATPEKALLDTFYLHQHGVKFPFDIYSDVNWSRVDRIKIQEYLQRYKNPKFVQFFLGAMNEAS